MGRIFAISDIHGCFKPFYELVVNTIKLKKADQLMLLGDYVDRGIQSRVVIDFILDKRYVDFFNSLCFYRVIGNYIFVHAGLNDDAEDPFSDTHKMIWETRSFYDNPLLSGKTVIHGHRPKSLSYVIKMINERSKVLPIDTGCVYGREGGYGFLSALEINSMALYSVPCE